jgi:modulator of FtsH protease
MPNRTYAVTGRENSLLSSHVVLRRTYFLLSLTLLFSSLVGWYSMTMQFRGPGLILALAGTYGLLFLTQYLRNSVWGIASAFAFTGFMGYTLGPLLNFYIHGFVHGPQIVSLAIGTTGIIFLSLSAYSLVTKTDFSFMGGFLMAGMIAILIASIASIFIQIPILYVAISSAFVLISSGLILFETSAIIHGGERNFIMATISLYVSIYNLFVSLLNILSFFDNRK